jgi:CheY-like chemotaxis protein
MSHEIRTPLNGVIGLSRIGLSSNKSVAEMKDLFSKVHDAGKGLLGIINDILDFSKLEAGKLNIELLPTNPGKVLSETIELLQEDAKAKGIKLSLQLASDFPAACLSDPLRLRQVLLNLISNALKFTPEGCVKVEAGVENGWISIQIKDTGIGMSPEQMARVFEAFEQADGSTTRKFGGTGLGLSITHHIVEVMQGTIQVSSTPGVGSCFDVRLPYTPAEIESDEVVADAGANGAVALRLSGIRILIAEDNEINQIVISENLADEGGEIVVVGDGLAAVNRVISDGMDAFDLVLMDVQMPVMDGYEATANLLAMDPDLPIIGQTAHAYGEEKARCFSVGMVDHIAKPIDPDLLVEKILTHARRRK